LNNSDVGAYRRSCEGWGRKHYIHRRVQTDVLHLYLFETRVHNPFLADSRSPLIFVSHENIACQYRLTGNWCCGNTNKTTQRSEKWRFVTARVWTIDCLFHVKVNVHEQHEQYQELRRVRVRNSDHYLPSVNNPKYLRRCIFMRLGANNVTAGSSDRLIIGLRSVICLRHRRRPVRSSHNQAHQDNLLPRASVPAHSDLLP
jgi:hypothetical protein